MSKQVFCPECDGRTYLGDVGINEMRCPTCNGLGILDLDYCRCGMNRFCDVHPERDVEEG